MKIDTSVIAYIVYHQTVLYIHLGVFSLSNFIMFPEELYTNKKCFVDNNNNNVNMFYPK